MMMKFVISILVASLLVQGCASMSPADRAMYAEIEQVGAQCETVADPGSAAILNVLLGVGDIYLATGEGRNPASWGAFVLDFLFWPYSVVWSIPQAIVTAKEINKIECTGYYRDTEKGRLAFSQVKKGANISSAQNNKLDEAASTTSSEAVSQPVNVGSDNTDKFLQLKNMYENNLITKEEYDNKRKLMLDKM